MNFLQRMFRATMDQIAAFTNSASGYSAGKKNRLTKNWPSIPQRENTISRGQLDQLAAVSWDLYRNNPYARKIVRTIESKVIGRGIHPQSQAKTIDGKPHKEFRAAAKRLWWSLHNCFDVRGTPGHGGLDLVELQKLALRSVILSGEVLTRPKPLTAKQQKLLRSPISTAIHMIAADRLSVWDKADGFVDGNQFYRGIELDQDGRRVAYHILTQPLDEMSTELPKAYRVLAEDVLHLYVQDDVDQLRGVPWFAPAIFHVQDGGDYQYNVLKASAIASCFVGGYRLSTGKTQFGANSQTTGDLQDSDGNAITKVQPGMLINLGSDGDLKSIAPGQPSTNAEAFIQHIIRGVGSAMPGVKASTVTGDYRNSSFSSERSADNDCWPEMESVQDWFSSAWLQPIYEQVIRDGILHGHFAGIVTAEEFADRESEFLDTIWSGPKPRSINPTDDETAANMRVAGGRSSPQLECASTGVDPDDVARDITEWYEQRTADGWPDWLIASSLGQTKQPVEQGAADGQQTSAAA